MIAAAGGWLAAALLGARCVALGRRLDAAGDAEHELRGAMTAFALALDRLGRDPVGRRLGMVLRSELERARAALDDLAAARHGHEPAERSEGVAFDRLARSSAAAWRVPLDWHAGPVHVRGDRGRLAQALGNLLSNAVEHGTGPIRVEARRVGGRVRLEVVNGLRPEPDRGRGLRIAARAAEGAGGSLSFARADGRASAALELPLGP